MSAAPAFTEAEHELLRQAAAAVVRRGLAVPTMIFLETVAPMNVVTSSMLTMLSPVWRAALPRSRIDAVAELLERREAIPELIRHIDELDEERRRGERAERRARKQRRGRSPASMPTDGSAS